jgi:hypothetical protein
MRSFAICLDFDRCRFAGLLRLLRFISTLLLCRTYGRFRRFGGDVSGLSVHGLSLDFSSLGDDPRIDATILMLPVPPLFLPPVLGHPLSIVVRTGMSDFLVSKMLKKQKTPTVQEHSLFDERRTVGGAHGLLSLF